MNPVSSKPHTALFVTCLVDCFRPAVGFAAVALLEQAGCRVSVPLGQTCCGQPAYNSGDFKSARKAARRFINLFESYDYVVAPSGSCIGMLHQFPELFQNQPKWLARAKALAAKAYELTSFLWDVMAFKAIKARFPAHATYLDTCSAMRELGIKEQPRQLLGCVDGLQLRELADPQACCGFGGSFCVKYGSVSNKMVGNKVQDVRKSGAEALIGGDLGCLLNVAGKMAREGVNVEARHVAEILAGQRSGPAIGEGSS